jgi:hypothetical protein
MSRVIQSFAGADVGTGDRPRPLRIRAQDVKGAIELGGHTIHQDEFFAHAPPGVCFQNGFAQASTSGVLLAAHSPDHRARFVYPFEYTKGAEPVRLLAYLHDAFGADDDKPQKIQLLREFSGACILGIATTHQRCIAGVGEGSKERLCRDCPSGHAPPCLVCRPAATLG